MKVPDEPCDGNCRRGNVPCRTGDPPSGIRLVAFFEASKGALVLAAGFGLFELVHRNIQDVAEELVRHFHLNPASHYPRIFIDASARLNDANLWVLASAAFLYAGIRLFEAYGLWNRQRWAEWLGAASCGLYIPIELFGLLNEVTWPKVVLLGVNTLCLVLIVRALRSHDEAGTP